MRLLGGDFWHLAGVRSASPLLFLALTLMACDGGQALDPSDAGANDAAPNDSGARPKDDTAFVVDLEIDAAGAKTTLVVRGRLFLLDDPPAVILAVAEGPASRIELSPSDQGWVADAVVLKRDFVINVGGGVELRDEWRFSTLGLVISADQVTLTGAGQDQIWLSTDVADERDFTAHGVGRFAEVEAKVQVVDYGEDTLAMTACGPLELSFDPPLEAGSLPAIEVDVAGEVVPLSAVNLHGQGGGYANRVRLFPAGCWPLGATLRVTVPAAGLHGDAPAVLTVSGPANPPEALSSSALNLPAELDAWRGIVAPVLNDVGAPFTTDGRGMSIDGAAAWSKLVLPSGAHRLTIHLSYWARADGVAPHQNPEWVRAIFGWSATLGTPAGDRRTESFDLVGREMSPAGAGLYALDPETLVLEIGAAEPREQVLELAPRSFLRSPAIGYGSLLVDSISIE